VKNKIFSPLRLNAAGKILICTICCREKDQAEGLLPALQRYRSSRIKTVSKLSRKAGWPFAILSGKYGLISADEPIPYYDRLMGEDDLGKIIEKNTVFLKKNGIKMIFFLIPAPAIDPHVVPYLKSMEAAAESTGSELKIIFVPPYPKLHFMKSRIN